jgi:hypothetical protein
MAQRDAAHPTSCRKKRRSRQLGITQGSGTAFERDHTLIDIERQHFESIDQERVEDWRNGSVRNDIRQRGSLDTGIAVLMFYTFPVMTLAVERFFFKQRVRVLLPAANNDSKGAGRIASPEMFPEAEMLPHLICSRPIFIGGASDEADQHGGA